MRLTNAIASVLLAVVAGGTPSLHAAQATPVAEQDQLLGTWQLNVAKSRYTPGPGPISETRTYMRGPNGVEGTIQRRFQDGRSERIEYISEYDREYPVMGTAAYDHIQLKRLDSRTAEAVLSHAGRVYGTARRVIAPDGKTMTITLRTESASSLRRKRDQRRGLRQIGAVGLARNVEIKARVQDLAGIRAKVAALAPGPGEIIDQTDTFFVVPQGRLKVRAFPDGSGELISYQRGDQPGPKESVYTRVLCQDAPGARRRARQRSGGSRRRHETARSVSRGPDTRAPRSSRAPGLFRRARGRAVAG